jgi:hypothetical protein
VLPQLRHRVARVPHPRISYETGGARPAGFRWSALLIPGQRGAAFRLPPELPLHRLPLHRLSRLRLPRPRLPRPRLPRFRLRLPRPRAPRPAAIAAFATWLVVGVALFTVYLHVSRTSPVDSDGASNAMQAWQMLHGNPLLRGWRLSDVSFYTTELPQYLLLEAVAGLHPDVVHLAGAMTYTLLVLGAALLAKGRAVGREGLLRAALAIGIMLAPQLGSGVYVLMASPDHTGSMVPVLAAFLVLDRAPRRWWVPAAAGLILSWALVADSIVLLTGVLPLAAVAVARGYQLVIRGGEPARRAWFEAALAAAALAAAGAARGVLGLIGAHGGFFVWPVGNQLATAAMVPHNALLTGQGLLLLFGADFLGHNAGYVAALAAAHLAGLGLAAWGLCAALRRLAGAGLAVQLLAVTALVSLAAYLLGRNAVDLHSSREFVAVLPCGAALAGRLLAGRLAGARMVPALAVLATAYLLSLGRVAALPAAPAQDTALAAWLSQHHLSYGLGNYWQASVVTLETDGKVSVRPVLTARKRVIRGNWEARSSWYDPAVHQASFLVAGPTVPGGQVCPLLPDIRATFGQPASISYIGPYTILVWNKNLLTQMKN